MKDHSPAKDTVSPASSAAAHLRIVRGDASDEEIAALTAVLSAAAGAAEEPAPTAPRSSWADPAHRLRVPLHPGPGAWRASALPR